MWSTGIYAATSKGSALDNTVPAHGVQEHARSRTNVYDGLILKFTFF